MYCYYYDAVWQLGYRKENIYCFSTLCSLLLFFFQIGKLLYQTEIVHISSHYCKAKAICTYKFTLFDEVGHSYEYLFSSLFYWKIIINLRNPAELFLHTNICTSVPSANIAKIFGREYLLIYCISLFIDKFADIVCI